MKKLLTILAVMAASLLAMTVSSTAFAGEATEVVKSTQTKLFAIIAQPKSEARQKKLRALFDEFISYDAMARASLGDKWDTLSAEQQKTFTGLLTDLIRNNYRKNLTTLLDFNIGYGQEESKPKGVLVNSTARHKTNAKEPPFDLDFHMLKAGDKWMIIDIITEDASMVKTYKAQFLRILKKESFDKLIEKMQTKLDKLEAELEK